MLEKFVKAFLYKEKRWVCLGIFIILTALMVVVVSYAEPGRTSALDRATILPDNRTDTPSSGKGLHYSNGPSLQHESARRKLEITSGGFLLYIRQKLDSLRHVAQTDMNNTVESILKTSKEYQRTLQNDFHALKTVDLTDEWRLNESLSLGRLVQNRLHYIQPEFCLVDLYHTGLHIQQTRDRFPVYRNGCVLITNPLYFWTFNRSRQHPRSCTDARKLVCRTGICGSGFACRIHHYARCLIFAYATERTMIVEGFQALDQLQPLSNTCTDSTGRTEAVWKEEGVNDAQVVVLNVDRFKHPPDFYPLSVPNDLADRLERFHGNPAAWWIGQILAYIFRPTQTMLTSSNFHLPLDGPYVGVHVRRTDKIREEAKKYEVDEYMRHVEGWFDALCLREPEVKRKVFLATDSPAVISEMTAKYPNYTIVSNSSISEEARPDNRQTRASMFGIIHDIYYLYHSDYLVCTLSSNVCRMAYALMQTLHGDAANKVKSLDHIFYMHDQHPHYYTVIEPIHTDQLDLKVGDEVERDTENLDGMAKVTTRDGKSGLVPVYKLMDRVRRVEMSTYPNVDEAHTPE